MTPRDGPAVERTETLMTAKSNSKPSPAQPPKPGRKPTHRLYRVLGDGDTAVWTPIGAAWPNKDGQGFSLSCDAVPLGGRLVLRPITARAGQAGGHS
jgi:hypothetical protein